MIVSNNSRPASGIGKKYSRYIEWNKSPIATLIICIRRLLKTNARDRAIGYCIGPSRSSIEDGHQGVKGRL